MGRFTRWGPSLAVTLLVLGTGCTHLKRIALPGEGGSGTVSREPAPTRPTKDTFRLSQYVFASDLEMKRESPLFQELSELREQVYKELRLAPAEGLIQVYIFSDRERYDRYIRARYPDLPERRAFFVAQPHAVGNGEDLLVFTFWSDRVRQDLRHELTHALLHSVLKDVPLWLDEGLAEYFELPPSWKGLNRTHVRKLLQGDEGFRPNLTQLEQLSQVKQMDPVKYREAWAWVYLMMNGPPEGREILLAYLQQLRTNSNPGPLQPRLAAVLSSPEAGLEQLLKKLSQESREGSFAETQQVQGVDIPVRIQ